MKLSELVAYKNQLDELSTLTVCNEAMRGLNNIMYAINIRAGNEHMNDNLVNIEKAFHQFDSAVNDIKLQVNKDIELAEKPWFQESYTLFEQELISPPEYILNVRDQSHVDLDLYRKRLQTYGNWKYSALIIRPGREPFIDDMVAFDPLYIVDTDREYIKPATDRFNQLYQERLRSYIVKENTSDPILDKLPDNQFGLCFAYNYFNFRPLEVIKKYFAEVYQKLKPGGAFILTFNDCDKVTAVQFVEQYYGCYTPGCLVRELAYTTGFEIIYTIADQGPTTWIELRKPGTLTSLRGGQSLGKIVQK